MTGRRYSLLELDRMRVLIAERLPSPIYEAFCPPDGLATQTPASIASYEAHSRQIEDELRTAIIAGLGPEDFPQGDSQ